MLRLCCVDHQVRVDHVDTVLDEFDEPIYGLEVVLLAREYGAGAQRYYRHNIAHTNDLGNYRFDYVKPDIPYLLLVMPYPDFRAPAKSAESNCHRITSPRFTDT